jgi:hypothetical protein
LPGFEGPPAPQTRRWSRALVAVTAVAVVVVLGAHLAATFLYNAPLNPVSQRYAKQVNWWMEPLFDQNWRLFAPNPISVNVSVEARARLNLDGTVTGWIDLSAQDRAAMLHDPVPGHIAENGLRNAWFRWAGTHNGNGDPLGAHAAVYQRYLLNMVLQRLRGRVAGSIGSVQVRAVTTPIPGPGSTAAEIVPQTRTLDWWTVPAGAGAG